MSVAWRPAWLALRSLERVPARYLPLVGAATGLAGGGIYWLAGQIWPSSVAVALSLFATMGIGGMSEDSMSALPRSGRPRSGAPQSNLPQLRLPRWSDVFILLIKYNALMALTAAHLGFPLPANLVLGLIMICGQAASCALMAPGSSRYLAFALLLGFAPATLLGIPGLMGLAAAVVMRMVLAARASRGQTPTAPTAANTSHQLTEACFYLGALATWKYV